MTVTEPHVPGQLSLDGPAGDLDARAYALRAQLEALDAAKLAAVLESLDGITARARDHREAGLALDQAAAEARGYGATWQQIADAAGITRQSAWKRWGDR